MRLRDLKNFSEQMNQAFWIMNKLTGTKVFESSVSDKGYLDMKICGRDATFNSNLKNVDGGMWNPNPFVEALKATQETDSHPDDDLRHSG